MKRPAKVNFKFVRAKPSDKVTFGARVYNEMSENASVFINPAVPLATLLSVNEALGDSTIKALSHDNEDIKTRNDVEKAWKTWFRKQAKYVDSMADGDETIIAKSGFIQSKTEAHRPSKLPAPELEAYGNRERGSIHTQMKPMVKAKYFIFLLVDASANLNICKKENQIKLTGEVNKVCIVPNVNRKMDFDNLSSGTAYKTCGFAYNNAGLSDMSEEQLVYAP